MKITESNEGYISGYCPRLNKPDNRIFMFQMDIQEHSILKNVQVTQARFEHGPSILKNQFLGPAELYLFQVN